MRNWHFYTRANIIPVSGRLFGVNLHLFRSILYLFFPVLAVYFTFKYWEQPRLSKALEGSVRTYVGNSFQYGRTCLAVVLNLGTDSRGINPRNGFLALGRRRQLRFNLFLPNDCNLCVPRTIVGPALYDPYVRAVHICLALANS